MQATTITVTYHTVHKFYTKHTIHTQSTHNPHTTNTQVEPIVEERKKLNIQIQAHLPQESFHTRNAITYIKTHEAVAKLLENLKAEHNVTIEFCAAVFKGVRRCPGFVLVCWHVGSSFMKTTPCAPSAPPSAPTGFNIFSTVLYCGPLPVHTQQPHTHNLTHTTHTHNHRCSTTSRWRRCWCRPTPPCPTRWRLPAP